MKIDKKEKALIQDYWTKAFRIFVFCYARPPLKRHQISHYYVFENYFEDSYSFVEISISFENSPCDWESRIELEIKLLI